MGEVAGLMVVPPVVGLKPVGPYTSVAVPVPAVRKLSVAPVAVTLVAVRLEGGAQAGAAPMVMVKSLVSPEPKLTQASAAPFWLPVPRLRIRIPVWPSKAFRGTCTFVTLAVPAVEVVATCAHYVASKARSWLKSIHTEMMLLLVVVTLMGYVTPRWSVPVVGAAAG